MPSFSPFRRTYSAVSSSFSSSDDIHSGNAKEIIVRSSTSSPRTIPRHSFLIRVVIFALLELGFIALVSTALRRPIFLHVAFTNSEVKGAVTAIAIIWHALAVYVVKDILLNVFSAEWIAQYDGSQSLALQELDIVSRLTAGFIDQAKHCVSERATLPFRLSFLSSILLVLLDGLGPSAIGVDHAPYDYPCTIQVANLTIQEEDRFAMGHANTVVQLEVALNSTTVGFSSRTPNILIPWPSPDSMSENMTIRYQSDVIHYDFNCSWRMPFISNGTSRGCVTMADNQCLTTFYPDPLGSDPSILPLSIDSDSADSPPLTTLLFVGRNGTLPTYLNLEGIPTVPLPCNTTQNPSYSDHDGIFLGCKPLLMSVLVCNPQFKVLPATINATGSSLEASISSGDPIVNNIPTASANVLFSSSLVHATSDGIYATQRGFSNITQQLFLPLSPIDPEGKNSLKPFSLDKINQNMTNIFASSAKIYLSGYKPNADNELLFSTSTVNTNAVVEVQKMVLVGSKPFFVASSVTVGLLVAFLGVIVAITPPEQLEAFELENIVKKLR